MIFPNIEIEPTLQVADKTRIRAQKSYVAKGSAPILKVEIEPDLGAGFFDVTGSSQRDWFLDWQYQTAGTKTVTLRVTIDDDPTFTEATVTAQTLVLTQAEDNLFSTDQDLVQIEEEVLKYVPEGRNSFLNVHRKAQKLILDELDERGISNGDGTRIVKSQVIDIEEVRSWSMFFVLSMIYKDLSNSIGDVFDQKAEDYKKRANFHRDDAFIRLDFNKDGSITSGEAVGVRTGRLIRS